MVVGGDNYIYNYKSRSTNKTMYKQINQYKQISLFGLRSSILILKFCLISYLQGITRLNLTVCRAIIFEIKQKNSNTK